jgi:hypothetical protein
MTRGIADLTLIAALAAGLAGWAPCAAAIEIESDLSTNYVEIRTNFQGAEITVFGAVIGRPAPAVGEGEPIDLIIVVRGPPQSVEIRRMGRTGPLWANRQSLTAHHVPSFYSIAATRPLAQITDSGSLERYKLGFDHIEIGLDTGPGKAAIPPGNPPSNDVSPAPSADLLPIPEPFAVAATAADVDVGPFRQALIRLLKTRHAFREDGRLTFIRANLFRAEIAIPATVPAGAYGAEVYLVQGQAIVDAEFIAFFIDKKGLEGDIYGLAHKNPFTHGILAVMIAAAAGWASAQLFRRR